MSSSEGVPEGGGTVAASIHLANHPARSSLMRLLQVGLKPLRPRLVAPSKTPSPAGSNRLSPHSSVEKKCRVEGRCRRDVWSYELIPKSLPTGEQKALHHVYYFAGGGFQSAPSGSHWRAVAELSVRLGGGGTNDSVRAHVVSYPLAPKSPARYSLRTLRAWLEDVLEEAHREGWTITLAGDSSGGNVAVVLAIGACGGWPLSVERMDGETKKESDLSELSNGISKPSSDENQQQQQQLGQHDESADVVRGASNPLSTTADRAGDDLLLKGRSPFVSALTHVLLICPAVDLRNTNSEMDSVGSVDPLLTPYFTGKVAECWRGALATTSNPSHGPDYGVTSSLGEGQKDLRDALSASDPRVSPTLADLNVLRECNIVVDGAIAGLDTLSPDAKDFVSKLAEAGVRGEWQVWEKMMHCWVFTWWAGLDEAKESMSWMVDRIRKAAAVHREAETKVTATTTTADA